LGCTQYLYHSNASDAAAVGTETMVDWDEEKLEQVVQQKHAESDMKKPKTEIVTTRCCCQYRFLVLRLSQ